MQATIKEDIIMHDLQERVMDANHARQISAKYIATIANVKDALVAVSFKAHEGKYSVSFMHDRELEYKGRSLVADFLKRFHGFDVVDSEGVDNKQNNHRTIIINWRKDNAK